MAIPSRVDLMLNLKRKPQKQNPINPRIRAYGKARLDIAGRASSAADWSRLWKRPTHAFPFEWGELWKQCIEYKVDDFAAEVGFYTDILGLAVNALDPGYAMFTSPSGDFFLAIVPTPPGGRSTPKDALRIQFMVSDVLATARELEKRGIPFEQWPQPCSAGSALYVGYFRTPHGICVDVWGLVEPGSSSPLEPEESAGDLATSDIAAPNSEAAEFQAATRLEADVDPYPEEQAREEEEPTSGDEDSDALDGASILDQDEAAIEGDEFIVAEAGALPGAAGLEDDLEEEEELIEVEYVDEDDL